MLPALNLRLDRTVILVGAGASVASGIARPCQSLPGGLQKQRLDAALILNAAISTTIRLRATSMDAQADP